MTDTLTLRNLVLSKYKTQEAFAEAIGWSKSKTSRIINGLQEVHVHEIISVGVCLQVDVETVTPIFFLENIQ